MSDENGLYYMRARYYNPDIKRFVNLDVLLGSIDEGQSLNRYAYVNGNPISYVDPFGTCVESGEAGHMALDAAGLWPGAGMYFDATNAVWYAAEEDWPNAGWSGLASIPGVGYFSQGVKYGIKAISKVDDASDVIKVAKGAGKQFKVDKIDLQMFAKGAGKSPNKVTDLAKDVKDWLGKDAKVITNKNGDKVFISSDGTRRIRFDINNTSPHNNPHGHVEQLVNGKWVKSGPLYPKDVPHN